MDQNLRETAAYFETPVQLQAAIDAARSRISTAHTQQQRESNQESLANYMRIAECKGWPCK